MLTQFKKLFRQLKHGKMLDKYEKIHSRSIKEYFKTGKMDQREFDSFISTLTPKEKLALQKHMMEYLQ